MPDNTYLISDPAKSLTVPLYMVVPANANIKCKYTLGASTPAFVSLVGDLYALPVISIYTTDVTKTGVYSIDVIYTDEYSGLLRTDTFVLTVSCVRTISTSSSLTDVMYYISDPAITRNPSYVLTPAGCPNELTYQVTQADGSALPGSIVFSSSTKIISVYETNWLLTATYTIKVTVTDPKTSLQNSSITFVVTIKCTKSLDLISGSVASYSYKIDLDAPWTKDVALPTYQQNPA